MSKNKAILDWLKTYEKFDKLFFNFSIGNNKNAVMIPAPNDYLDYQDITGAKIRYYTFAVSHFKHFTNLPNNKENLDNMNEVQDFLDWIDTQNKNKNFPLFPSNCTIEYVKNLNNIPSVTKTNNNLARFYSQIQIKYIEK